MNCFSQDGYLPASLVLKNGQEMSCFAKIPSSPTETHIKYKYDRNEQNHTIESDSIFRLIVKFPNTQIHTFEHTKIEMLKVKKQEIKIDENEKWVHLDYYTEKASIYSSSNTYSIKKDGSLRMTSSANLNTHAIKFYIKRLSETNVFQLAKLNSGPTGNKLFYKNLKFYLKSDSAIYDKIIEANLGWTDLYKIAELYNLEKK